MDWKTWCLENLDPLRDYHKPEALEGVRVLDISENSYPAMVATSFLGEWGAEVIKVEPPGGEGAREWSPRDLRIEGTGLPFWVEGRNKYFITLDWKRPVGKEILDGLISKLDVLVENLPSWQREAHSLGYERLARLNPRLIQLSLVSWNEEGPMSPCDVCEQALSGVVNVTGEREGPCGVPTKAGNWLAWYAGWMWGAFSVMAALFYRGCRGEGQLIDISPAEGLMRFVDYNITWYHMHGKKRERVGNMDKAVFPYTYIKTKDGYTFLAAYNEDAFRTLCHIIGKPLLAEDPRFSTGSARVQWENEKALQAILEEWSTQYTSQEIFQMVNAYIQNVKGPGAAVVVGPVSTTTEVLNEENWWDRGALRKFKTPEGEVVLQNSVPRMSLTPPRIKWTCKKPGADNAHIYARFLGYGKEKLKELRERGII